MAEFRYDSTLFSSYEKRQSQQPQQQQSHQPNDNTKKKKRCPIHKMIRNQQWEIVRNSIRRNPSLIFELNGVGWTSFILSIYHSAPDDLIAEMLHLVSTMATTTTTTTTNTKTSMTTESSLWTWSDNKIHDIHNNPFGILQQQQKSQEQSQSKHNSKVHSTHQQQRQQQRQKQQQQQQQQQLQREDLLQLLLSQPVPTGNRLCLHFATRFSSSLEVIKLITEAYPKALLHPSTDGCTPLDRAIYYRKDSTIVSFLQQATKQQRLLVELKNYNQYLKIFIKECCQEEILKRQRQKQHQQQQGQDGSLQYITDIDIDTTFILHQDSSNVLLNVLENEEENPLRLQPIPSRISIRKNDYNDDDNDDDDDDDNNNNNNNKNKHQNVTPAEFIIQIYLYLKEREMMGIFDNILSYFGVYEMPLQSPQTQTPQTPPLLLP